MNIPTNTFVDQHPRNPNETNEQYFARLNKAINRKIELSNREKVICPVCKEKTVMDLDYDNGRTYKCKLGHEYHYCCGVVALGKKCDSSSSKYICNTKILKVYR